MIARLITAAIFGVSASANQPNSGRPTALNTANTPTSEVAVPDAILMTSLPTGLEMPMAIRPARQPIV